MIVVRIMGGLGNQLFQYALGRALSVKSGERLLLDLTAFDSDPQRFYMLDRLNIAAEIAPRRLARRLQTRGIGRLWRAVAGTPLRVVREQSARFDPAVLDLAGGVYLDGYWQSEKYFDRIAASLRADFALRAPLTCERLALSSDIAAAGHAVSVHVRRGDYASNPVVGAHHGTVPAEWYAEAMARMIADVPDASFFVFSDDPEWARAHLPATSPIAFIVPAADGRDEEDMHLMSRCRHHVIANSTFSWWAAWLNPSPDKRVIAPRRWFLDPARDARDIVPEAWERL